MAAHRATMRGRAVPFRAVMPPMSPVFTPEFSLVVPPISAMRGQHVCRRRMLSSGQRHLLPAERTRPTRDAIIFTSTCAKHRNALFAAVRGEFALLVAIELRGGCVCRELCMELHSCLRVVHAAWWFCILAC